MAAANQPTRSRRPNGSPGRHINGHGPSRNTFEHQPTRDALSALHPQGVIAN
jgi:hypothetical protein